MQILRGCNNMKCTVVRRSNLRMHPTKSTIILSFSSTYVCVRVNLWLSTHISLQDAFFVLVHNISTVRTTQYRKEFLYLKGNFLYLKIEILQPTTANLPIFNIFQKKIRDQSLDQQNEMMQKASMWLNLYVVRLSDIRSKTGKKNPN